MRKIILSAIGVLILVALSMPFIHKARASSGCSFSVACYAVNGETPLATLTCTNGINHDPYGYWASGHPDHAISYCHGDIVVVIYNNHGGPCIISTDSPSVHVSCFSYPTYTSDSTYNISACHYQASLTLTAVCNSDGTCTAGLSSNYPAVTCPMCDE